jgi:hypothetical protein
MLAVSEIEFSAGAWLKPFEGREAMMPLVLLAAPPVGQPAGEGLDAVRGLVADPVYQLK